MLRNATIISRNTYCKVHCSDSVDDYEYICIAQVCKAEIKTSRHQEGQDMEIKKKEAQVVGWCSDTEAMIGMCSFA